jgi:hypothetical protein
VLAVVVAVVAVFFFVERQAGARAAMMIKRPTANPFQIFVIALCSCSRS